MRKWLCAAVALGTVLLTGLISAAPAMARDGSFSCRASALRIGPLEPLIAGDRPETIDNTTDASDPCRPGTAGLADYKGPLGCYIHRLDPNCFNPNQVSVGLLYATTEECRPNTADPRQIPNPGPGDFCRSTPGAVDLNGKNATPVLEGDGVKSRAGVADLFITDSSGRPEPAPNFLHLSAINSFAEVTCRPTGPNGALVPNWEVRSQVVYVNGQLGPLGVALDVVPGLIPNASPTVLNRYGELGPIRFNATYINNNEPGGVVGPDEGQPRRPNPTTGDLNLNGDADPSTPAFEPVTKVVQRAVDVAGAVVAGEAVVDVTRSPCRDGDGGRPGTITVKKVTNPADDPTVFTFTDQNGGTFQLAGGQQTTTPPLPPGNYTITETDNPNFEESVACTETGGTNNSTTSGRQARITLEQNEVVTCTFTNTRGAPNPNVIIRKNTVPNDPQDFSFTGSGTIGAFQLDDDNDATLPRERGFTVAPGEYTVTEAAQRGWRLSDVECTDPTNNSRGDDDNRTARINVAAGEVVTCTFTNRKAKKPPKCDRDGDGKDDHDRDRDGRDDRDKNGDGRDDRNGRDLHRASRDRNHDGRDDECERDRKNRDRDKCSKRAKKSDNDERGRKDKGDRDRKGDRDDKGDRKGDRDDDDRNCKSKRSKKSKKSKK